MHRKTAAALVALFTAAVPAAGRAAVYSHNPESLHGPKYWGEIAYPWSTCGVEPLNVDTEVGKKQSPVDITGAVPAPVALPALAYLYGPTPLEVENNGHAVEVKYAPGSQLRIGSDTYDLVQFHFHAPSEHTINGVPAAAELHLVHRNALGDLAVVGVLLQVGAASNLLFDDIIMNAPLAPSDVPNVVAGRTINAKSLLPPKVTTVDTGYYTYSGSLTTPPCSEGVRWTVLKQPVIVSQQAIDRLHQINLGFHPDEPFADNNRPVRPLNGRVIYSK